MIREYVVSEAMHALGCALPAPSRHQHGEPVIRNRVEPGGILTRVASSHLELGPFSTLP
ncbi:MAG: hypothetical protein CM15mP74_26730 [Halieaceae bacterium]|nr:MAG: hypothetical protein CM15mP74_26730 [Halieaceae bacterium]